MKRIKDFIHDTNDILLAVIIVLIAAGVIFWRLNIILDYPDKVARENVHAVEETAEQDGAESAGDAAEDAADADQE